MAVSGTYDEGIWWSQARGVSDSFRGLLQRKAARTFNQFQAVIDVARADCHSTFEKADCSRSIDLLRAAPPAALLTVMQHPSMIYWTAACEHLLRAELGLISEVTQWAKHLPSGQPNLAAHFRDLTRFAISASLCAKQPFDITWTPLYPGAVSFPGSGMSLGLSPTDGPVRTRSDNGQFDIIPRVQTSSSSFEIDILDFNLKYGWAQSELFPGGLSASVLSGHEIPKCQDILQLAMDLLAASHPIIEQEISLALKCVVPLTTPDSDVNISVSAPEYFGAIMFSLDPAPMLMEVLIHEYRHNILHLLNEEINFFEESATAPTLLYSPWRPDPRPPIGLLHALFTFSEVVRGYQLLLQSDKLSPKNQRAAARRCIGHTLRLQFGLNGFSAVARLTPFSQGLFDGISASVSKSAELVRYLQVDADDVVESVHTHRRTHCIDRRAASAS